MNAGYACAAATFVILASCDSLGIRHIESPLPQGATPAPAQLVSSGGPPAERGLSAQAQPAPTSAPTFPTEISAASPPIDEVDSRCATILSLAGKSSSELEGLVSDYARDRELSRIIGCAMSRDERAATRASRDAELAALRTEKAKKDAWVKAHCRRLSNVITSDDKTLRVEGDEVVYNQRVMYIEDPPSMCPKGTAPEMVDYAMGSYSKSPLKRRIRELERAGASDERCDEAAALVKRCRESGHAVP